MTTASKETEPCIGYCDPTGVGKHPHPEWPADKICDECFEVEWRDWIENRLDEAVAAIGEEKTKEFTQEILGR